MQQLYKSKKPYEWKLVLNAQSLLLTAHILRCTYRWMHTCTHSLRSTKQLHTTSDLPLRQTTATLTRPPHPCVTHTAAAHYYYSLAYEYIIQVHLYTLPSVRDLWQMESLDITPPDQVSKAETMARGAWSPILWQPVIASPVIQQRMEELQTAVHPLMDDWGGHHWLPQIGLCASLAMVSVLLTRSGGIISSDSICQPFRCPHTPGCTT